MNRPVQRVHDAWIEVSVRVSETAADAVAAILDRHGKGGAVVEVASRPKARGISRRPVWTVRAYLRADRQTQRSKRAITRSLSMLPSGNGPLVPAFHRTREAEWTERWKKGFGIRHVGRRLAIVPSWKKYRPKADEVVIRIDPGLAFGTGLHPTTRLCLREIERHLGAGAIVLDVGTGTGILTMAAAGLGASRVVAIDNDPRAAAVARSNAAANGVASKIRVVHGTLHSLRKRIPDADLIAANILSRTILAMAPDLFAKTKAGGVLIAGGILAAEAASVEAGLSAEGFKILGRKNERGWSVVTAIREAA